MARAVAAAWVTALVIGGAVVYAGWWLATPGDCTAVPPTVAAWQRDGVVPDLRGTCDGVRPGDLIIAAQPRPGAVAYTLSEGRTVIERLGVPRLGDALATNWSFVVFVGALVVVAGYAFARRRAEPAVPDLLVFAGALAASSTVTLLGLPAAAVGGDWQWLYLAQVVGVYTLAWSALLAFVLRFPDAPTGRAGLAAYLSPAVVLGLAAMVVPGGLGGPWWAGGVITVQGGLGVLLVVAAVVTLARRFRRLAPEAVARQQMRIVGAGGVTSSALLLAGWLVPQLFTGAPLLPAGWIGLPGLPFVVALTIAVLRYRIFDLDVVVARTAGYVALSAAVVTLYLGIVAVLAVSVPASATGGAAIVATIAVALVVNPMRNAVQGMVNRLLYGDRHDPYAALRRLGRRLAATSSPAGLLPAAAADVATALRLPFVAVDLLHDGAPVRVASAGTAPTGSELHVEPLVHQGEVLGSLVVAPRAVGERPAAADRRLLSDLADQIGAAAQVVRLDMDLRRSREQLVLAREEERKALRRALHDEVGPTVAALALRAETARRLLPADAAAAAVLAELRGEATAAAGTLRRLAYDLRPPALDELGLVGALREYATRMAPASMEIAVEAPEGLPRLPAAVEVAAYRITAEAVLNAVRHAAARTCTVRLAATADELVLVVTDDGNGWPDELRVGVGIAAMRERGHELRGHVRLGVAATGGAEVRVTLPLTSGGAV